MQHKTQAAYEATAIDQRGFVRSESSALESITGFQAELQLARELEENGKIRTIETHQESHTGHRFVDAIRFVRLA